MRVKKIDLIRYGHFSETSIEFPKVAAGTDFHLVFGPNEAGKSTARLALEDFFFGVPAQTPHGFKHGYNNLQIGATIESGEGEFDAIRRKGRSNTLRHRDKNAPVEEGEATLRRMLANSGPDFFKRMFSLDHQRLREGARTILDADDDIGRALFSATVGVDGLQDLLNRWKGEADLLWKQQGRTQKFHIARNEFERTKKIVDECSVKAGDWEALRDEYEQLETTRSDLVSQIRTLEPRQRKLIRIRRVKAKVTQYDQTASRIAELGAVYRFAEDAMSRLDELMSEHKNSTANIEWLNQELEQINEEVESTTFDERVIRDEDEITELNEQRAQVGKSKQDLFRAREELSDEQTKLQTLASRLGWESSEVEVILGRIPSKQYNRVLRDLTEEWKIWLNKRESANLAQKQAETKAKRLGDELDNAGGVEDLTFLHSAIETAQKELNEVAKLSVLQRELNSQVQVVEQIKQSLSPAVEENALASLMIPARNLIVRARDELRDLEEKRRTCKNRVQDLSLEISKVDTNIEGLESNKDFVTAESIEELRRVRDDEWVVLKRRLLTDESQEIEPSSVATNDVKSEVTSYEEKVRGADGEADRRFRNAETEARYSELLLSRNQLQTDHDHWKEMVEEVEKELLEFSTRWQTMWGREVPFEVASPETMLVWHETHESLLSAIQKRNELRLEIDQLSDRDSTAQQRLCEVLDELVEDSDKLEFASLTEALTYARQRENQLKEQNTRRNNLQEKLNEAIADNEHHRLELVELRQQHDAWNAEWLDALVHVGLSETEKPQKVSEKLDIFDELRSTARHIDDLTKNVIRPIEADIGDFNARVDRILASSYPEVVGESAEEKVLCLADNLRTSQAAQAKLDNLLVRLSERQEKKLEMERGRERTTEKVDDMRRLVGAEDVDSLRASIQKSDDLRGLLDEQALLEQDLETDGDGLSTKELREESESVQDLDEARSEEEELDRQLSDLREQERAILQDHATAKQKFEEVRGSANAAQAEFEKECALAEMKNVIEEYIPIRASAVVLDWAIDKFRKERQGPLIKRAGEIFKTLTQGSFVQLEAQMGSKAPTLVAYRDTSEEVALAGLSEGTVDQLYLALRIAAIEEHIASAKSSMPLVIDDLFTNFDDERAAAGLQVLLELSRKCQVLFFTHHNHLVDIARNVAGEGISVNNLSAASAKTVVA